MYCQSILLWWFSGESWLKVTLGQLLFTFSFSGCYMYKTFSFRGCYMYKLVHLNVCLVHLILFNLNSIKFWLKLLPNCFHNIWCVHFFSQMHDQHMYKPIIKTHAYRSGSFHDSKSIQEHFIIAYSNLDKYDVINFQDTA